MSLASLYLDLSQRLQIGFYLNKPESAIVWLSSEMQSQSLAEILVQRTPHKRTRRYAVCCRILNTVILQWQILMILPPT